MSHEFEFYHGVVLCRIVHNSPHAAIELYSENSNSSYIVNSTIGIYVKYSTKRMSPWQFTFTENHCQELFEMIRCLRAVFLVLVCKDYGIVCLSSEEVITLLDDTHGNSQGLLVSRKRREKFRVSCGKRDSLKLKIAGNEFPLKIFRG